MQLRAGFGCVCGRGRQVHVVDRVSVFTPKAIVLITAPYPLRLLRYDLDELERAAPETSPF